MSFKSIFNPLIQAMSPNQVAKFTGYHISHNNYESHYGGETTAFVLKDSVFLILNGDHRQSLLDISKEKGLDGCLDYFNEHIEQANKLSEHKQLIGVVDDVFNLKKEALEVIGQAGIDKIKAAHYA